MSEVTGFKRVGLASEIERGKAILIPRSGQVGGGGEYGANITDELRTFAVTREPVAHRIVFTVAHDVFDNWFNIKLKEGKERESEVFDQQIQEKLSLVDAKTELTRIGVFERAYGWAILVLGYTDKGKSLADPLQDPKDLITVKAYPKTQISSVEKDRDQKSRRYDLPLFYNIQQSGLASRVKVHYSRVIHFATRLLKSDWQGKSALDACWDDLVTLRNIRWGMGQTMYRYGSGFPDLTFTGAEQEKIDEYVESGAFSNLSARTYFVHNENQALDFKGLAGRALDPLNYYLPIMENISCASGIPLAILRGVQAGALTGSQVNEREYYGLISDEQTAYEPGIRQLIQIILDLQAKNDSAQIPDWSIEWKSGFELTEEQKVDIELKKAQVLHTKGSWLTINELRALEDPQLPELPAGIGDQLLGKSRMDEGDSFLVTEMHKRSSPRGSSQA